MIPPLRLLALLLFGLLGCAGSGEGLDRFGLPRETDGDTGLDPYVFTQQILEQRCSKCHQGSGAPKGLDLSAENSYDAIVGVPSKEVPTMLIVAPGAPRDSYLWVKIVANDERRQGSRMPRDGPPYLDETERLTIREWIFAGALHEVEE